MSGINSFSPNPRLVGRIFQATTGTAGPRIDFGAIGINWSLGVASHPSAAVNPSRAWVVNLGTKRYQVLPDGSFTPGSFAPTPDPSTGEWTLNWVAAPTDGYAYERLLDGDSVHRVRSGRHPAVFGAGTEFDIDYPGFVGRVEDLAHDQGVGQSLAIWSSWECPAGAPCGAGYRWRILDQ